MLFYYRRIYYDTYIYTRHARYPIVDIIIIIIIIIAIMSACDLLRARVFYPSGILSPRGCIGIYVCALSTGLSLSIPSALQVESSCINVLLLLLYDIVQLRLFPRCSRYPIYTIPAAPIVCKALKKSTYIILYFHTTAVAKARKCRLGDGVDIPHCCHEVFQRSAVVERQCKAAQGDIRSNSKTSDNEPRKKWEKIHNVHNFTTARLKSNKPHGRKRKSPNSLITRRI